MNQFTQRPRCPHCDAPLQAFTLPDNTGWENEAHLACFNDDCPYYRDGWQRMETNYGVRASYRYRINPTTGKPSPLAVWSDDAVRNRIIDAEEGADAS